MKITQKRVSGLLVRVKKLTDRLLKFSSKKRDEQSLLITSQHLAIKLEKNLRVLKEQLFAKERVR